MDVSMLAEIFKDSPLRLFLLALVIYGAIYWLVVVYLGPFARSSSSTEMRKGEGGLDDVSDGQGMLMAPFYRLMLPVTGNSSFSARAATFSLRADPSAPGRGGTATWTSSFVQNSSRGRIVEYSSHRLGWGAATTSHRSVLGDEHVPGIVFGSRPPQNLVQVLSDAFVFRSRDTKAVSSKVMLRNLYNGPVVYWIDVEVPQSLNREERAQYIATFRVRNSYGILRAGEETKLRAMLYAPIAEAAGTNGVPFGFTVRAAALHTDYLGRLELNRRQVLELLRRSTNLSMLRLGVVFSGN